jgi:hypothetical protein
MKDGSIDGQGTQAELVNSCETYNELLANMGTVEQGTSVMVMSRFSSSINILAHGATIDGTFMLLSCVMSRCQVGLLIPPICHFACARRARREAQGRDEGQQAYKETEPPQEEGCMCYVLTTPHC